MAGTDSTPLEIRRRGRSTARSASEIGRLELAPGERLRLEELAGRFGVSLTPVRHALRRLESEGLVVSLPPRLQSGAALRRGAEGQALRLGLETSSHGSAPRRSRTTLSPR